MPQSEFKTDRDVEEEWDDSTFEGTRLRNVPTVRTRDHPTTIARYLPSLEDTRSRKQSARALQYYLDEWMGDQGKWIGLSKDWQVDTILSARDVSNWSEAFGTFKIDLDVSQWAEIIEGYLGSLGEVYGIVDDPQETTLQNIRRELDELIALGPDWDGHGALQIVREASDYAFAFAQALPPEMKNVAPFAETDGSVGLEYHKDNKFSLYLSFSPQGEIAYVAVFRDPDGSEEVHRGHGIKASDKIPVTIGRILDAVD